MQSAVFSLNKLRPLGYEARGFFAAKGRPTEDFSFESQCVLRLMLMWHNSSFYEPSDSSRSFSLTLGMELLVISSYWFRKVSLKSLYRGIKYFMGSSI